MAVPPVNPLTCQVTAVFVVPETVALNCLLPPVGRFTDAGEIETEIGIVGGGGGAVVLPPPPHPAKFPRSQKSELATCFRNALVITPPPPRVANLDCYARCWRSGLLPPGKPERRIRNSLAAGALRSCCRGSVVPCMRGTLRCNRRQVNTTGLIRSSWLTHEVSSRRQACCEEISLRNCSRC